MKISPKTCYSLQIMLDLAERYNACASAHDVAERQKIPMKYAEKLFGVLKRAGFVTVTRGSTGGYRLSRDPSRIRVIEIVRLMEGEYTYDGDGKVRGVLRRLRQAEENALGVSLSDILNDPTSF